MRRLAIYFFYDKDGVADRYIDYFLNGLTDHVERLVVVSNSTLVPEARNLFLKYTSEIIERDNTGFDVWAYKTAMNLIGWEALCEYDEVILLNFTIMGPVYPFSEMFSEMEKRELDFWGITTYDEYPGDPFGCNPYGYLPEHLQSHFVVYRRKFMQTHDLQQYWAEIPAIESYADAIGKHESFFTKHFADMGYQWAAYVRPNESDDISFYMLMFEPKLLVEKYRCPIFKRRSFFHPKDDYLQNTIGESAVELFRYLKYYTSYDTDLIWENVIRSCHMSDIANAMGLFYVLPDRDLSPEQQEGDKISGKIVLLMHLYYIDLLEESLIRAKSMPKEADIFIVTPRRDETNLIEEVFSVLPNKVTVRAIENRGRDVSGLLIGCADIVMNYDIACFYHDKKVTQIDPLSVGRSFAYKIDMNTLASSVFVENVIRTFMNKPYLGMLSPGEPNHSIYFPTIGREWGPNYDGTKELHTQYGLKVPISNDKIPMAPLGTVFWFRPKALRILFERGLTYNDFPPEPNDIDGTILHAYERLYPFVVQDAGYYAAYIYSDTFASIEISNLRHYLRNYYLMAERNGVAGTNQGMVQAIEQCFRDRENFQREYVNLLECSGWTLSGHIRKWLRRQLHKVFGKKNDSV